MEQIQQEQQAQQIFAIKSALISNAKTQYRAFLDSIINLPTHPFQRQQAMINFDQGMMWFVESVMNAPIAMQDITPEGQRVSQPESTEASQERDSIPEKPIDSSESEPVSGE